MAPVFAPEALLGLHLADALTALRAAGEPEPVVARTAPTRTRHALPETVDWRVARARRVGPTLELVAVAALPLPEPTP